MPASSSPFGRAEIEPVPGMQTHEYLVKSFRKPCVDFHWHFHPELEITCIEQGQGVFHAGRSVSPYSPGDLFLLGPNLPHAYGSHPKERTGARWTVMHFLPERWGPEFWLLPQNQRIRELLAQSSRGILFRGREARRCAQLLLRLQKPAPDDVGLALWMELLERLARSKSRLLLNAARGPESDPRLLDPRLQDILSWIDDHVEFADLTQAAAASRLGLSPQAFCRFFRERTGRPFHRYVNELRIAHACSGLANSRRTVSEIGFHSGYNNLANFNRRFRELIGQTPTQYRQSRRG